MQFHYINDEQQPFYEDIYDEEERYSEKEILRQDSFGITTRGLDSRKARQVLIKKVSFYDAENAVNTTAAVLEVILLHCLCHRNIVSLNDLLLKDRKLVVVTDFYEYSLYSEIYPDRKARICRKTVINNQIDYIYILYQVLDAVKYLHSLGVLHRDIRPSNILLGDDLKVELTGFGSACSIEHFHYLQGERNQSLEPAEVMCYRAPESFLTPGKHGKAQDVWAVACTFCEIFLRSPLFSEKDAVDQVRVIINVKGNLREKDLAFDIPKHNISFLRDTFSSGDDEGWNEVKRKAHLIHPDLYKALYDMLQFNPTRRLTASNAMTLPLFKDFHVSSSSNYKQLTWYLYYRYMDAMNADMSTEDRSILLHEIVNEISINLQQHETNASTDDEEDFDIYEKEGESVLEFDCEKSLAGPSAMLPNQSTYTWSELENISTTSSVSHASMTLASELDGKCINKLAETCDLNEDEKSDKRHSIPSRLVSSARSLVSRVSLVATEMSTETASKSSNFCQYYNDISESKRNVMISTSKSTSSLLSKASSIISNSKSLNNSRCNTSTRKSKRWRHKTEHQSEDYSKDMVRKYSDLNSKTNSVKIHKRGHVDSSIRSEFTLDTCSSVF